VRTEEKLSERTLTEDVFGELPDDYEETPEQSRALQAALSHLDHRERLALELYYGLNGQPQLSEEQAAARLPYYGSIAHAARKDVQRVGVGVQTFRQVHRKALRRLRHPANRWINHCPWCHRNGTMNCKSNPVKPFCSLGKIEIHRSSTALPSST
jgi:DNA-directed RNA polymerase specialized sigma subunit